MRSALLCYCVPSRFPTLNPPARYLYGDAGFPGARCFVVIKPVTIVVRKFSPWWGEAGHTTEQTAPPMTHNEYNGWWNYETWAVNLWMDNEQGSQEHWREVARAAVDSAEADEVLTLADVATYSLAETIKQEHEEALPELTGFASDLLNAAMTEVHWQEIARHLVDEVMAEAKA